MKKSKMFLNRTTRIAALLLALLLLPCIPFAGQAARASSATVPVRALYNVALRNGAGKGFEQVGVMRRGEILRSTREDGDWTIVRYKGLDVYVQSKYIEETTDALLSEGYVRCNTDVRVRNGPSSYARPLGLAEAGELFPLLQESEDWYQIDFFGVPGAVSKIYFDRLQAEQPTQQEANPAPLEAEEQAPQQGGSAAETPPATDATLVPAQSGQYAEAVELVYVYSNPSEDSSQLGKLYEGSIVPKLGTIGGWIQIEYNKRIGYVPAKYMRDSAYSPDQAVSDATAEAAAKKLIELMNENRRQAGAEPLAISNELMAYAKIRAQEITVVYSHTRPDGSMCNTLAPDLIFGENIARGTALPTPEAAAKGFMSSEAHRINAMDTRHTLTGAACVTVNGETFWVQLFGK